MADLSDSGTHGFQGQAIQKVRFRDAIYSGGNQGLKFWLLGLERERILSSDHFVKVNYRLLVGCAVSGCFDRILCRDAVHKHGMHMQGRLTGKCLQLSLIFFLLDLN